MPTATLTSQLDRGVGGGNQALNPLALTSHLLWVSGKGPPRPGLSGWRRQTTSFLEELWVFPFRPHSPFLGKCISYSVCNVDPSPGGVEPPVGAVGGVWPSMPPGGAGGQLHRDFSSQTDRRRAESPEPAQHVHAVGQVEIP